MLSKLNILLVEDNPGDADLIEEILLGYPAIKFNIINAVTLQDSYKKLEENKFDIVLLDLGLPDSTGLDTLNSFITRVPRLPVIVTTGFDDEEAGIQAVKMGAQEYLSKGHIEGRLLFKLIIHAIERKQSILSIREQAKNLHLTLDSAGDAVISTDTKGVIVRLNQEASKLTGWNESEAVGKSLEVVFKIVNQQTGDAIENPAQKVLENGESAKLTNHTLLVPKKGEGVAIAFSAAPILSESGVINGTVLIFRDQTEEYENKKKIIDSELKYRSLFNSIRDALLVTNTNREIVDCNPAFIDLFGYSREEILGEKTITIYKNENEFLNMGEQLKTQIDKADFLYEVNYKKKDGTLFCGETNVFYLKDEQDVTKGFIGLIRDISPRKKTEEKLIESERRYRLLAENTLDIIWTMNMDLVFTFVNPAVQKITGYKPEEWINTHISDHYSGPEMTKLKSLLEQELARGKNHSGTIFEVGLKHKDGSDLILEIHGKVMMDDKGRPLQIHGTARDITERRKTEQELETTFAELLLRDKALNSAANAILITNINGTIEWVNEAFATLTGYKEKEALGKNPRDLIKSGKHPKEFYKNLWDTILAGKVWKGEFINKRKDGTLYYEEETITPVVDNQDKIKYFIGIKTDISDRKKLEEQLRQSQKMEAVGQLAGGVAHDFNNLLTVINGYSELLLATKAEGASDYNEISQIRLAGQRASALTRQLLAFSRRQILATEVLDINSIIGNVEKMLRRLLDENIDLKVILNKNIAKVEADPGQIEQVILNLSINARDAMPKGGKLTIRTDTISMNDEDSEIEDVKPGDYVQITITDTGMGMTPETQLRIFEPFFTTKEEGKGTGLGLSTVYGIVKQSDGFILVDSKINKGTTFKVLLPVVGQNEQVTADEKKDNTNDISIQGKETILVAEDDDNVRTLVERSLTKYGYTVLKAADGPEALSIVKNYQGKIDLLLTDVVMPKMSGKELADRIVKNYPGIKICFMSGYTDGAIARNGILDQDINFIQKPFAPKVLALKIKKILEPENKS